jgi:hypothetical protein
MSGPCLGEARIRHIEWNTQISGKYSIAGTSCYKRYHGEFATGPIEIITTQVPEVLE